MAAALAMDGNGVVGEIAHGIGLVVADGEIAFGLQQRLQRMGEAGIAVVEHADLPGPRDTLEDRGEAVHGDQHRGLPRGLAPVELGLDALVIGLEDLARPGGALGRAQIAIAGNLRELAEGHDRALDRGIAVAVDHEARIDLADGEGVQRIAQEAGDGGGPDIPGDMALELGGRQAEIAQLSWQVPAAVIAGEEKG